jgi:hypothetical protein
MSMNDADADATAFVGAGARASRLAVGWVALVSRDLLRLPKKTIGVDYYYKCKIRGRVS